MIESAAVSHLFFLPKFNSPIFMAFRTASGNNVGRIQYRCLFVHAADDRAMPMRTPLSLWFYSLVAVLAITGCERIGSPGKGAITYVDATDGPNGNTQLATGQVFTAVNQTLPNDNLWSLRPYGNGGTVFTSNDGRGPGSEDAPALVTKISGLDPGASYNIYAYFWSDHDNWQLEASVNPTPATTVGFSKDGTDSSRAASQAVAEDFNSPTAVTESNRNLYQANLGRAVADSYGEIRVWIDDNANAPQLNRTWYDGVGYSPANQFDARALTPVLILAAVALVSLVCLIISLFRNRRRARANNA